MRRLLNGRRPTSPWIAVAIVIVLIAARWFREPNVAPPPVPQAGDVRVRRVVDGDTLLMENGDRVRLIGVDTPETKRPDFPVEVFGPEASEFTRQRVEGKLVRLELDKERTDQYGRVLAYVYVGNSLLNEEILRAGLGRSLTQFPYSPVMKRRFREAEAEAQRAGRGIWSKRDKAHTGPSQ